jgi:anhydro-N-acetylmuramic acid kinase
MSDSPAATPAPRHVVGVMTGTSIDGIDAALVRVEAAGLAMRAALVRHESRDLGELRQPLRNAAGQQPMSAGEFARLSWEFGKLHAHAVAEVLEGSAGPDLICIHGQTVFHQPPHSWQLVNPAPAAERFQCPVVFDLRQADLAAGGQGAPITPIADWVLFRDASKRRAIVNLGGFCNVTVLAHERHQGIEASRHQERAGAPSHPSHASRLGDIRGFDVCACNQLLDAVARDVLGVMIDFDGRIAGSGSAHPQAAEALRGILDRQRRAGRSLGTGDEALAWIAAHRHSMSGPDLAASAVAAIAATIADAVNEHQVDELILAGGGARNRALAAALACACGLLTVLSDTLGVPIEAREAMAFAVLGALCADGVPITLPQVTGCRTPAPISGTWIGRSRPPATCASSMHVNG